jgi:N-acetylmuramoyl-L-alanine amidase
MAVFLLRTMDPTYFPPACTTPMFSDVPCSNPLASWINEIARRGWTNGYPDGTYGPNNPVRRDEMATFLVTAFGLHCP